MAKQDSGKYSAAIRANGIRLSLNEPLIALGTVTLPASTTIGGSALGAITSASATAFAVGLAGATNPAFVVDSSTALQAAGLKITGATAAGTVAIASISSGVLASLSIDAKGAGIISIGGLSTGGMSIGRTTAYTVFGGVVNTTIATQNATPTAAQMLGGLITHASVTGAGTFTVPTGALMSGAISGNVAGDSFRTVYANTGTQTVTITAASGNTLTGTVAVLPGKNAEIFNVCTGASTWISNITLSA